jgi:hypothetical protein
MESMAANGVAQTVIAKQFGVSRYSMNRHMIRHVSPERRAMLMMGGASLAGSSSLAALAEKAAAENVSLLEYLQISRSMSMRQMLIASEAGDRHGYGVVTSRFHEACRLIGNLTGEVQRVASQTNIAIMQHPYVNEIVQMIVTRLRAHPEALREVLAGLEAMRGSSEAIQPALTHKSPAEGNDD